MQTTDTRPGRLATVAAVVRSIVIFVAVLSIPLAAAKTLGLTERETGSWILAGYGLPGLLGLVMTLVTRKPLVFSGNIFFILFIAQLGTQLSYAELIGAAIVAGGVVLLIGILGLTERITSWIPMPIVYGLLAGAVLPFVMGLFRAIDTAPLLVGGTLLVYLASRRLWGTRVPPILPALLAGAAIAALSGQFGAPVTVLKLDPPQLTLPVFTLRAILTASPLFVVLITLQGNLPSLHFLHSQGFAVPDVSVDAASGAGTMLISLLGPSGVSLALLPTSLIASPDAGAHEVRHWAAVGANAALGLIGALAGIAAALDAVVPLPLLQALAGLALFGILGRSIKGIATGTLFLGPLFTFVIAVSGASFLGLGAPFWALVVGTGVSWLLEADKLRALRAERAAAEAEPAQ